MPFSLAVLLLIVCIEYLAIEKEKENKKRRCVQSLETANTSSRKANK